MCNPELLADRYLTTLVGHLGLTARLLEPNDPARGILVHHRGLAMLLENHAPEDPEYLRITCRLTLDDAHEHVAAAAQRVTRRCKLVKANPSGMGVTLSVEMLTGPPDTIPAVHLLASVLPRSLNCLQRAADDVLVDVAFRTLTAGLDVPLTADADDRDDRD
jgi:hypothetical protein